MKTILIIIAITLAVVGYFIYQNGQRANNQYNQTQCLQGDVNPQTGHIYPDKGAAVADCLQQYPTN